MHIEKAVDVTKCCIPENNLDPAGIPVKHDGYTSILLAECKYFTMSLIDTENLYAGESDEKSFTSLIVLDGEGEIKCGAEEYSIKKGDSIFMPADSGSYYISGKTKILLSQV